MSLRDSAPTIAGSGKAKIALVTFGALLGLAASALLYAYVNRARPGTAFENLEDLRRAMLKGEAISPENNRALELRDIINPHPDDRIIYDLRPTLEASFQGVPITSNSCGMRDDEHTVLKPPSTFRLALLGDSFAFGWGVRQNYIFAAVIEQELNRLSDSVHYEVLNFGIPGYSTSQEVANFFALGKYFQPDAILIYFIENDFALPFYVRDIATPDGLLDSIRFSRLDKLDPRVQEQRAQHRQFDPNRALRELDDYARPLGIRVLLAINPRKKWDQDRRKLWILRERPGIELIDIREDFLEAIRLGKIPDKELVLPTDPHPSAKKHELLGKVLAQYFLETQP